MIHKVKCRGCKVPLDRLMAMRIGLSYYCGLACVKPPKPIRRKAAKPLEHYDQVLAHDNYACRICGSTYGRIQVHHIRYRSQQGTDEYSNLITLCQVCHTKVHAAKREDYEPYLHQLVALRVAGDRVTRVVDLQRKAGHGS